MSERKWFPTGNLAWKEIPDDWDQEKDNPLGCEHPVLDNKWFLVQEAYEVEIIQEATEIQGMQFKETGRYVWLPVPVLPSEPCDPRFLGRGRPMFSAPLMTPKAPNIAGPNQSSNPATG